MERLDRSDFSRSGSCAAEAGHFYMCGRCGQYVDRRSPEQVRHHQRLSHKALRTG
jgi:hypothetical protein